MPMAMIACCFSTNEFFTRNSTVVFVEMVNESKLLLERLHCLVFVLMSTTHLMTLIAYNFPFSSILMFIRQVVLQPVAKW
jgi:hypothetical protein